MYGSLKNVGVSSGDNLPYVTGSGKFSVEKVTQVCMFFFNMSFVNYVIHLFFESSNHGHHDMKLIGTHLD